MSDDEPDTDRQSEGAAGDGSASDDESGTAIPISTSEGGDDSAGDSPSSAHDASEDAAIDEGVEIEVETGSPGPDIDRRSSEIRSGEGAGIDVGGSGTGIFDRLDESVVTLLSRMLDTETHLRVYVSLRRRPWSTATELAEETGLYPRTVRDALAALEVRSAVTRRGSPGETDTTGDEDDGDGRGEGSEYEPEYAAVAPSAVLLDVVGDTGRRLPEGLDLDRYVGSEPATDTSDPVRIDVEDGPERTDPDEPDGSEPGADDGDERDTTEGRSNDEDSAGDANGNDGNETN